ncbi:hypothetical protein AJ80_05887 [Polytolypa hystricis UAMH7299]|uniref:DNA-directed RNA polymerase subunit n=1 Tax=Polytolypa hystricis (strain UAMH7299) TaxID=1447883 RepID=A0A2B7Y1H9_POLH7|nr:hypothetical protein AJ80_05887 [Polytolypa hystricis UAMH7299]
MSVDAMDIDPAISSPEKKRKHKDADSQSSKKKRKHHEQVAADAAVEGKKKEKRSKHKRLGSIEAVQDTQSPSKKRKHHKHREEDSVEADDASTVQAQSPSTKRTLDKAASSSSSQLAPPAEADSSSPFHLITSTLYLPLSPISISPTHALSSLLAEHVSPLLLTYYPPFRGIVLAYSNASISSSPPSSAPSSQQNDPNPKPLTLAVTANEYGVLYVYLTATFLVLRPERSQILEGWINVQSEGFLGAIVYNLFSVGIEKRRLPSNWTWITPGQETAVTSAATSSATSPASEDSEFDEDKENFRPVPATSLNLDLGMTTNDDTTTAATTNAVGEEDDLSADSGFFQTQSGRRVRGVIRFRVRDVDVIPGSERDKGFLSIEGTMLKPKEEAQLVEEERHRAGGSTSDNNGDARDSFAQVTTMSGALPTESADIDEIEPTAESSGKKRKEKKLKKSTS